MYSHEQQHDQVQPPPLLPAPPTIMHQLVDNVSGPLYHQQEITTYAPTTTNTFKSPLPPLSTLNINMTEHQSNGGYAHHPSQPHLPAEPIPSTTNMPTTPMTVPQLAEFAATMTYFLWHVRKSSVMALHSASSHEGDLTSSTANLSLDQGNKTTAPIYQQQQQQQQQQKPTNPAFQRFCQQILASTQVSESVVLLALKYIAKLLQKSPGIQGAGGSEYRLFIVAILLANKFHDDNTFTNKTWSDISGMKLHELDIMELEFLNVLDFCLFVGKEEFDHWKTGLFTFMVQVQNDTFMQEQQIMDATLRSMGLFLPPPSLPQDAAHFHPQQQPYLFSTTAQPELLQIQPLNTPVTRVPLRIPSYPVYMPISSSASSTPSSITASHVSTTSYVPSISTPIDNNTLYHAPQVYHQQQGLSNSNPASYASTPIVNQIQQSSQSYAAAASATPVAYPTPYNKRTSNNTPTSHPLPRNASTPSLSAWAHQSTRSTTPMDQTQPYHHHQPQHQHHHHHYNQHSHHHHNHHHQRAYRPYQRPIPNTNTTTTTTATATATTLDHQQPLVDYYAWKSLTQGETPPPPPSHRIRRRSYSNPFPQQQMVKPYAIPRQPTPHDSHQYQDYQQIGADPSRLQHDHQQ